MAEVTAAIPASRRRVVGLLLRDGADTETAANWVEAALGATGAATEHVEVCVGHESCELCIRSRLATRQAELAICFSGHSTESAWWSRGAPDRVLLDVASASHLIGSDVLAISCRSTQLLGPAAVKAGAKSYAGFRALVVWDPRVALTRQAVGRCIHDLVSAFVALAMEGGNAAALKAVPEKHYRDWCTLQKHGERGAASVLRYIYNIMSSFEVLT